MKKIIFLAALCSVCSIPARSQSDQQIIRHENPVISIDKGPTEIWFLHTTWYEYVGPPKQEQFRNYAIKQDSAVRIVHKEASIPLTIAHNAYVLNKAQIYDSSEGTVSEKTSALGIVGRINFVCREATYDPATLAISSKLVFKSRSKLLTGVIQLGSLFVLIVSMGVFQKYGEWWTNAEKSRSRTATILSFIPSLVGIIIGLSSKQPLSEHTILVFTSYVFLFAWGVTEGFIFSCYTSYKQKSRLYKYVRNTAYVRGTIIGLILYAIIFYCITNSWLVILGWLAIAIAIRAVIRIPGALKKNFKNSTPPVSMT